MIETIEPWYYFKWQQIQKDQEIENDGCTWVEIDKLENHQEVLN